MDKCKYCGERLTWLASIKSFTKQIWKPISVICPNCTNKNYLTKRSDNILRVLYLIPLIFFILYFDNISTLNKALLYLICFILITLTMPLISKYRTEDEYKKDKL